MRRQLAWAIVFIATTGCSSDSPVAPVSNLGTTIEAAHVILGGQQVDGQTVSGEQGQTLFQLMLRDRDAMHLSSVEHCEIRYEIPGMGHMAPVRLGTAECFDDGTHGDDIPGDGIYYYLDADDAIGCGRVGMPVGTYEYQFHCTFDDGSASEVTVTVTRG